MTPSSNILLDPLVYFRQQAEAFSFRPITLPSVEEDRNLLAFRSKEDFIDWYGQPPGKPGQPYRDELFYVRELARVSQEVHPRRILEMGTAAGIGTVLLHILNPTALLASIDINRTIALPGDHKVPTGYLAVEQGIAYRQHYGYSWQAQRHDIDLCFIDADHSFEAVTKDSDRAYYNRPTDHAWAIIWHDYTEKDHGVRLAVETFCDRHDLMLQKEPDSGTVWVQG